MGAVVSAITAFMLLQIGVNVYLLLAVNEHKARIRQLLRLVHSQGLPHQIGDN